MKHYFILLALLLFTTIVKAQDEKRNKGLSGGIEFRYLSTNSVHIGSEKMDNLSGTYGKSLRFKMGYFFNPHIYTGISIGADRYEVSAANTFPLTVNLQYYLKDSKNTFFSFAEAGPQISFSEATDNGYMSAIGVGYKFFVSKRFCLAATLGYNYQRSNEDYITADHASRQSILMGLGIHF